MMKCLELELKESKNNQGMKMKNMLKIIYIEMDRIIYRIKLCNLSNLDLNQKEFVDPL